MCSAYDDQRIEVFITKHFRRKHHRKAARVLHLHALCDVNYVQILSVASVSRSVHLFCNF